MTAAAIFAGRILYDLWCERWARDYLPDIRKVQPHLGAEIETLMQNRILRHPHRQTRKLRNDVFTLIGHLCRSVADSSSIKEPEEEFSYSRYLNSPEWKRIRLQALRLANNRCEVCNSPHRLHVHHRTYARIGEEDLGDLTILCADCHDLYESRKRGHK